MEMGTIYKIENVVNGKAYIGQTVRKPKYRINRHLTSLREGTHYNTYLQRAYDKYGENSFKVDVLEKVPQTELDERERHWISYYRNTNGAYNSESGGNKLKTHSKETRKKISIATKKALSNPEVRSKLGLKGSSNPNASKVICINTGEVFETMTEAANKFNLNRTQIFEVCNGNYKSAGYYTHGTPLQFAYYEEGKEYELQDVGGFKSPKKVILTNTGEIFSSMHEGARKYNLSQGSISKCCKGDIKSAGKLPNGEYSVWVYKEDYNPNKEYGFHRHKGSHNPRARQIICLTTGEIFDTMVEAGEKYNISSKGSKISLACTGKRKHVGSLPDGTKLKWMYYKDYQALTDK